MNQTDPSGKTGAHLPNLHNNLPATFVDGFNAGDIPFDAEIESVRQQYCASSGRPLSKVPADVVSNLITIHGRSTAIKVLQTQQIKYSYDWIWLNHEGLANLADHRPAEYFVYATSKLLQDITLHSELMRMREAARAWQHLQSIDDEMIIPINELLRRLLAGWHRSKLNKHFANLVNKRVDIIASSMDNIIKFQMELTDLIQLLVAKRKKREQMEKGMSVFKMQRMIRGLSSLELDIGQELNDFDIIDGKSSEVIHAHTGTAYRHAHINHDLAKLVKKENAARKYSTIAIRKPAAPFKLKIGGGNNG